MRSRLPDRPPYRLAPHVRVCCAEGYAVLLDVKRNKYLGVGGQAARVLSQVISDWPPYRADSPFAENASPREYDEIVRQMLNNGMLIPNVSSSGDIVSNEPDVIERELIEGYSDINSRISLVDIVLFVAALTTAFVLLRATSLERIVQRSQHRRERMNQRAADSSSEFDYDAARRHTIVFRRLRPFFYTAREACMFDSIALGEFLAYRGLYPNTVIGVRTRPFRAHCWLQQRNTALNDSPEHVRLYTPLLTF